MAVSLSAVSSSVAAALYFHMTRWMYRRRGATVCPSWRTPHLRRNHRETAFVLVEIGLDYWRSLVRDLEGLCQTQYGGYTRVLFRLLEHQMSGYL